MNLNPPLNPASYPTVIRVADCPPQPWKNGGGITRELLAHPSAADWVLRISVADITQDGAFSSFAGITRSFAVIEGAGVALVFGGESLQRLEKRVTPASDPLIFDGANAPYCRLIQGSTRDLNLMHRAGHPAALVCAYGGQRLWARGFFNQSEQTLLWFDAACLIDAPSATAGERVGWWVV